LVQHFGVVRRISATATKSVGRKIFRWRGGNGKEDRKIALLSYFQGGEDQEKNSKKD